jgi:pimeloyl-ACP methyl ester carboxylesterase
MLAGATHRSVLEIETETEDLQGRYSRIHRAVLGPFPLPRRRTRSEQKSVIFILHGIRASNRSWVQDAAVQLKHARPDSEIVPSTYWYFTALQFAIPIIRRKRLRWFKDEYTYFLSKYPKADFDFVGHSNGTYLLGHSLAQLPQMRFNRIVLAGSVLPKTFEWRDKIGSQVQEIWNHRSKFDVPVAILCSALRGLRMRDIGTAGYDGFEVIPQIHECAYHPGGHGAPLERRSLPSVLRPLIELQCSECCHDVSRDEASWFSRFSRASGLLPYLVLVLASASSYFGAKTIANHFLLPFVDGFIFIFILLMLVTAAALEFL